MGQGISEVDPARIAASGKGISEVAQRLQADWAGFCAELAGFGEPWGTDDVGTLIGVCYQAVYEAAVEAYASNVEALGGHGEAVTAVARAHEVSEQERVAMIQNVRMA